jgi:hypothetical protein
MVRDERVRGADVAGASRQQDLWEAVRRKEGSTSFLKKRSKKLLLIAGSNVFDASNEVFAATRKSFLVLFFKTEHFLFRNFK